MGFRIITLIIFGLICHLSSAGQEIARRIMPIDEKAKRKTVALYTNLHRQMGNGIFFGHQDDLAYGVHWNDQHGRSDVKEAGGAYPAVYGWEVSKLGNPFNIDTVYFERMKVWIKEGYKRGGIITISWHMDNPVTGGSTWDNTRAAYAILPGGEKHEFYTQRLDLFAEFIRDLKVGFGRIPVIFRPFHEHTGSWFWWGKGQTTPEEYIELWRFTVHYLRDVKKLHNLLYAYSPDVFDSEQEYLEYYPGDQYVDILAYDDYRSVSRADQLDRFTWRLSALVKMASERGKVAALSETGLERIPIDDWWTEYLLKGILAGTESTRISYVLVWRNARPEHHYAPFKGHPSEADFRLFKEHPLTLFDGDYRNPYKFYAH